MNKYDICFKEQKIDRKICFEAKGREVLHTLYTEKKQEGSNEGVPVKDYWTFRVQRVFGDRVDEKPSHRIRALRPGNGKEYDSYEFCFLSVDQLMNLDR